MKKLLSIVVVVLLVALSVTPALACGSHHGGTGTASYSVCAIEDCTLTGLHTHNGKTYAAHYYGDGHEYHAYCSIANCTQSGYHEHNGAYCFGHTANDGHRYHHTGRGHH